MYNNPCIASYCRIRFRYNTVQKLQQPFAWFLVYLLGSARPLVSQTITKEYRHVNRCRVNAGYISTKTNIQDKENMTLMKVQKVIIGYYK